MPRFAANLGLMFNERPFLERFRHARKAGFTAVEFYFPYEYPIQNVKSALDDEGLLLVTHNLPAGNWDAGDRGMACDPRRKDEFRRSVALGIEYAAALGGPRLHCMAGKAPAGVDERALRETLVENLAYAAREAKQAGLGLLIEPINTYDIPGYYLRGSDQALAILDAVGADNLFLQYDVYHMQRMEGELAATLARLLPHIGHVQVADNPGRHEPGTGEINYAYIFAHLDRIGYAEWVGCEYRPAGTTEEGLGWLERTIEPG